MKEKNLVKMDLQLFADGEGQQGETETAKAGQQATGTEATAATPPQTTEDKKFTQADIDRILNERLSKEKKKFETQLTEEKRLAQLTAEEQERERFKKEKEEFENEKKIISKEKMTIEISRQLSAEGLPASFANRLYSENADDVKTNISEFRTEWKKALDAAVENRIKGKTPQGGTATTEDEAIKASIRTAAGLK